MYLNELIHENECENFQIPIKITIENVTTSVERISENTLFVLINSIKFDVRNIINYIIAKRPAVILADMDIEFPESEIPVLKCNNTRSLLPYIYSRFYLLDYSKLKFVGITGTNGKSTTAEMIRKILEYSGKKVGFIGTGKIEIDGVCITDSTYSMTTPDPELLYSSVRKMQDSNVEYVVMEVSSHALYFDKVLPITYKVGIFTNFSRDHLDFHENIGNYFNSKLKLFRQSEIGIFNLDDEYCRKAYKVCESKKIGVGIIYPADTVARCINILGLRGSQYIYNDGTRLFKVNLKLPAPYNIYNSLLALRAAIELGVKPCIAKKGLEELTGVEGRLEIINKDLTVIIDYAHTEEAVENLLKFINSAKIYRQKIISVFGCGGDRDPSKRPKFAKIAEKFSELSIVTTDNSRSESENEIIKDILKGFSCPEKRRVIKSRTKAIKTAIQIADKNDIVVIFGKGHERYNIDKNGSHRFDEREIIKEALMERKLKEEKKNETFSGNFSDS